MYLPSGHSGCIWVCFFAGTDLEKLSITPLALFWIGFLKGNNAKFIQICSDEETNSSTSWMACGWEHFQQIFIFGWTVPLNCHFKFSFEWRTTLKWSFVRSWQAYIKLSEKTDNLTGKWTSRKTVRWTETARVWWSYSLSSRWLGQKLSGGVYTSTTISFPPWLDSLLPLQDNPSWPLFPGQCPAPLVSVNKDPELWSPKSNREEPGTKGVCMPSRNQGRQRSLNVETVAKHRD